ncbi:MAG TPA: LytTR family DNA-binding domain-containing protein [Clostridia bacterium]|nr:MAG: Transcriptional regulatory protein YpdB [Firmicutes bacterium ADurb.Bin146]HOD92759.1 LytTR family DNA-binding domain-containing protein [Clostridia bacterium]HQM39529.1 LytTR family DNA-binding domain-containing protein [Clostridia bacterium]
MKQLRIAICDDDNQDLLQITSLVEAYKEKNKTDITFISFNNATDLLESMSKPKNEYDLLLLDVLMTGFNGMQTAHEIREYNDKIEIVFLTSSPEYAVESYKVRANNYILKPATEEKLFPILDSLIERLKKPEESFVIKTKSCVFTIPFRKIEYVEINAKILYIYLADGKIREIGGSMTDFEASFLKRSDFIKVHRSYLVNMHCIHELRHKELVTTTGRLVPISRTAYSQVRTAYTKFLFEEADELAQKKGEN